MTPSINTAAAIATRFASVLGDDSVFCSVGQSYAIESMVPALVLKPRDAEALALAVRIAQEENCALVPFGGGTRQHIGRSPERLDLVLSTERLNAVEAYDPGDLMISLQAGVTVSAALGVCGEHWQMLPIDAFPDSTVGGSLATAASGPWRCAFGGLRDFCIGINFVTGDGAFGRGGGRVVKNVAGYDLMKLMIGSYGSLAIITSASFKLFPAPQQTVTLLCEFESGNELFRFRDWLLRSPLSPVCAEAVSPTASECLNSREPRDPDVWAPANPPPPQAWRLALRFAGSDGVLARCRREIGSSAGDELNGSAENHFWQSICGFEAQAVKQHRNAMIFQVEVPIAESQSAMEAAHAAATNYNFHCAFIGRASVGSFVVAFLPLAIDPPAVTQFASAASDFRSRLSRAASAVVVRCPREAKLHFDVWGSTPTDSELMRKIKRALDPQGILNRGRFFAG